MAGPKFIRVHGRVVPVRGNSGPSVKSTRAGESNAAVNKSGIKKPPQVNKLSDRPAVKFNWKVGLTVGVAGGVGAGVYQYIKHKRNIAKLAQSASAAAFHAFQESGEYSLLNGLGGGFKK